MLFDTRIVFLITALNISTRQVVKTELNGDECFIKMLKNICIQCEQDKLYFIKEDNAILVCEILKALFNLYINSDNTTGEKSKNLISILNKLLLFKSKKDNDLQRYLLSLKISNIYIILLLFYINFYFSNIANLLTVMPYNCYSEIISPTKEKHKQVFQNMDMSAVFVLLKFLDRRLNCKDDLIGNLSPIVTAFIRMVKAERLIRKYTRLQVKIFLLKNT